MKILKFLEIFVSEFLAFFNPLNSKIEMANKVAIFLPAPLRYQYDKKEWWSIYTNSSYDKVIPWYRRLKHWPLFPVLLDNIAITFKSIPKVSKIAPRLNSEKFEILDIQA